ncbi:hypothetical protein ACFL3I_05370 [Pseudomonadota bacterium]
MNKVVTSILWGVAAWIVFTFLVGSIWGMTNSSGSSNVSPASSNLRNMFLLVPALMLSFSLVNQGRVQLLKRIIAGVVVALLLWFALSLVSTVVISQTVGSVETARNVLHVVNPVLLVITLVCSGIYIFRRNSE